MKFREYDKNIFLVKKLKPNKVKDLNPNTLRVKTYKRQAFVKTKIPIEKRTFNNLPRYSNKRSKVHFKEWLGIKGQKRQSSHDTQSFGKAEADGKWYGWSHRAVSGFGVGDTVKCDTCGNASGKEYVIKTDDQAKKVAMDFADDVS